MLNRIAVPVVVLSVLVPAACGPLADRGDDAFAGVPPGTVSAWTGSVAEGGVVRNPDRPLLESEIAVEPAWRVSTAAWRTPAAVAVGEKNVYVLDQGAGRIHVVSRAGQPGDAIGDAAGMSRASALAYGRGVLAIADPGRRTAILLDPETNRVIRTEIVGDDPAVAALADGTVLAHGGEGDAWRVFPKGAGDREIRLPDPPTAPGLPPGPCRVVAGAGEEVIQASCYAPAFQVLGADGARRREVRLDRAAPASSASPENISQLRLQLADKGWGREDVDREVKRQVALARTVSGARYDASTKLVALWTQTAGAPAALDLFSAEGVYLATVRFPSPWADFAVAGGTVYALESEGGATRLAAYRLRIPRNAVDAAREAARGGAAKE